MKPDERALLEAARSCDDCICWLEYCEAECCGGFNFRLNPQSWVDRDEHEVRIHVRLSEDSKRYYELHGARVGADEVAVPVGCCEFSANHLHVSMPCSALQEDRLCSLHPDEKPEICKALSLETGETGAYVLTKRCLFAYKLRLMASDEADTSDR